MLKGRITKSIQVYILISTFFILFFSFNIVSGQVDSASEIQKKLTGVSEEEKQVFQALFVLLQEIEALEIEEQRIKNEIEVINKEASSLERKILNETASYKKMQEDLKQVLKSYQRMGAGSYLKIVLESDSLTALIRRINTVRDLTRNTGELLAQLDHSKERLELERSTLTEKLMVLEMKQNQLNESLDKKTEAKENIEKYLSSLEEERAYYEEYLNNIQVVWNRLKDTFSEAAIEFSRVIKEEDLPADTVAVSLTLSGIRGEINENGFNNIIKDHANLPEMEFSFYPGKIEVTLPKENLTLSGTFIILEDNILKFEVLEGKFYEMPLESSAIEELFKKGYMLLDLKPLIGTNRLRSIEIRNGYIELLVIPVLR